MFSLKIVIKLSFMSFSKIEMMKNVCKKPRNNLIFNFQGCIILVLKSITIFQWSIKNLKPVGGQLSELLISPDTRKGTWPSKSTMAHR